MEERLEDANVAGPLASPHNWQDMESLAVWCRAAAALQPDGTDVPATRCEVCIASTSQPHSYPYVWHEIRLQQLVEFHTIRWDLSIASCLCAGCCNAASIPRGSR